MWHSGVHTLPMLHAVFQFPAKRSESQTDALWMLTRLLLAHYDYDDDYDHVYVYLYRAVHVLSSLLSSVC